MTIYESAVVSRWEAWQAFREQHPILWAGLYQGYRVYRLGRRLTYRRIHRQFRDFSMLPAADYRQNLALVDQVRHVPGAVVECGTWRGGMSAGMAALLGPDRHYYLFDSYEGLPPATALDMDRWGQTGLDWQSQPTNENNRADEADAREAMRRTGVPHVTVTKGWFEDTLPGYNGGPIAILRADGDWYESTKTILTHLFPSVVPGGIVILDDYYYWDGCAKAAHEFLVLHGGKARLYQFGNYIYIRKP